MGKMHQDVTESRTETADAVHRVRKRSKIRSSKCQINAMLCYMAEHPRFANGNLTISAIREEWKSLARSLNELGSKKTVSSWQITWRDLRSKRMKKNSQMIVNEYIMGSMRSSDEEDNPQNKETTKTKILPQPISCTVSSIAESELSSLDIYQAIGKGGSKRRCNNMQLLSLIDYMSTHPELAKNRFGASLPELKRKTEEWSRLAVLLNKIGIAKPIRSWQTTWRDLIRKSKKAARDLENKSEATTYSSKSWDEDFEVDSKESLSMKTRKVLKIIKSSDEEDYGESKREEAEWVKRVAVTQNILDNKSSDEESSEEVQKVTRLEQLPCATEDMPILFTHSLSPPPRLNSSDLDFDENSTSCQDIGPESDVAMQFSFDEESLGPIPDQVSLRRSSDQVNGKRDHKQISGLFNSDGKSNEQHGFRKMLGGDVSRQMSDEVSNDRTGSNLVYRRPPSSSSMSSLRYSSDREIPGCTSDEVSNKSSNQVSRPQSSRMGSVKSGNIAPSLDIKQASSVQRESELKLDNRFLPRSVKKKTHACTRAQKAALLDYMRSHVGLAKSTYVGLDNLDPRYAEWRQLTKYLNKMGPARSTWTWKRDWKELIVRSTQAKQNMGSKGILQKNIKIQSNPPSSEDNFAKTDTEAREEIVSGDVSLPRISNQRSHEERNSSEVSPTRSKSGQMSPMRRDSSHVSPQRRNSGQMSPERSHSSEVSPTRRKSRQMSPEPRHSSEVSPARRKARHMSLERLHSSELSPARRKSLQMSPERPNSNHMSPDRCSSGYGASIRLVSGHVSLVKRCYPYNDETMSPERRNPGHASPDRRNSCHVSPARRNSGQMSPVQCNSGQMSLVQHNGSGQMSPVQSNPGHLSPVQPKSGQMSPVQCNSGQMSPLQSKPGQISPVQSNPGQMSPVQSKPDQMSPVESNPDQMSPVLRNSGQTPAERNCRCRVISVKCYAGQGSSQDSAQTTPVLNSGQNLRETVEGPSPTESDIELDRLAVKRPSKTRCTMKQINALVEYMSCNPCLVMNGLTNRLERRAKREGWRRLSKYLNKMGNAKSVEAWRTTWRDLKRHSLNSKDKPKAQLPDYVRNILEILEAYEVVQATTTEDTMLGENGQTHSLDQSRKTSEFVGYARCSNAQIEALVDFMTVNSALATSKYTGPCADDPKILGWRQLSRRLNRMGVARSVTGWQQIWRYIVANVRKSEQSNKFAETFSRKVLKALGDKSNEKRNSELNIDNVEEDGQMSPVQNSKQTSPPHNTDLESPVYFDQMSPMHNTEREILVNFDQMSTVHNTDRVSPVDFNQKSPMIDMERDSTVNFGPKSSMHNTSQVTPLRYVDNVNQMSVNFGQTSPVHNKAQSPVNTGQKSPVKFGQMSPGHNNRRVYCDQADDRPGFKRVKSVRPSRAQVKALVNYMSTHPSLASCEQKGHITVEKRQLEWRRLGKHLNRMGPTKSTYAWRHTWLDLKRKARVSKKSQIYRQILNIVSPAKDGRIDSYIGAVENNDTHSMPRPTENISIPFARSPSPELCLNAPDLHCDSEHSNDASRHQYSGKHCQKYSVPSGQSKVYKRLHYSGNDSQQTSYVDQSDNVSNRHKNTQKRGQETPSLRNSGAANNISNRLQDSRIHSEQTTSVPRKSGQLNNVSNRHQNSRESSQQTSVRSFGQSKNGSTRFQDVGENRQQNFFISSDCGQSNNVSRIKNYGIHSQNMSLLRTSGQSNKNQLSGNIERERECNLDGSKQKRLVEGSTRTRRQLNALVEFVCAHPAMASEHEHAEWRTITKLLNKMGPLYCNDITFWKNKWQALKDTVTGGCKKNRTYTGCLDRARVKKVLELAAKYPSADCMEPDVQIVEDMPTQESTTHHFSTSAQHKLAEVLSRSHTVDGGTIDDRTKERATSNVNSRTAGRDFLEIIKEGGDKASSATASSNISNENTNNLLKELIEELKRSNELKVEQNSILKQIVTQLSTDDVKSSHNNKKENKIDKINTPPDVIQKREVEDLTEEYSGSTRNSERSGECSGAHIQNHKKDNVYVERGFPRETASSATTPLRPQVLVSSKKGTSSPKKHIRTVDISRLMKPALFKPTESIQRLVKLKSITRKVPTMPKVNLLRMKDGTMVLMPGTKLPASNDEYQTFVVGSVKNADSENVVQNENELEGFEDYEF